MKNWITRFIILGCTVMIAVSVRAQDEVAKVMDGYTSALTCYAATSLSSNPDQEAVLWWVETLFGLSKEHFPDVRTHMATSLVAVNDYRNEDPNNQLDVNATAELCAEARAKIMAEEEQPR